MPTILVRASRRAKAYTRTSRLMLVNRKINKKLSRGGLSVKRENQLYKLQNSVKTAYRKEVLSKASKRVYR